MLARIVSRIQRRLQGHERGQVLVLVAGLLAVFGGMTAVAVDLGSFSADRRDHQNYADAIALAASLELPDAAAARAVADEWALKNGIAPTDMTVEIIQQSLPNEPNPKVRVALQGEHEFTFARLIGINSATVRASAAAIKTSAAGGDGIVPFSVNQDALAGVAFGEQVVLKYDANNISNGNTSPVAIDGSGNGNCRRSSNQYCSGVAYGSDSVVCAVGADPTYCTGPTVVDTEPGNMIGGTRTAVDYRIDNTDPQCDEFSEVFEDDPTTDEVGVYRIIQECNPYLEGGYSSLRVIIIPVIDQLCNGRCQVTIVDFALFFLDGYGPNRCQGNDCEIIGQFVRVNQNVGLLAGTFNPESFNLFVRLVE